VGSDDKGQALLVTHNGDNDQEAQDTGPDRSGRHDAPEYIAGLLIVGDARLRVFGTGFRQGRNGRALGERTTAERHGCGNVSHDDTNVLRRLQANVLEKEANGGGCRLADRFGNVFGDGASHAGDGEYDEDNAFNEDGRNGGFVRDAFGTAPTNDRIVKVRVRAYTGGERNVHIGENALTETAEHALVVVLTCSRLTSSMQGRRKDVAIVRRNARAARVGEKCADSPQICTSCS
jgi:hypothetical protein